MRLPARVARMRHRDDGAVAVIMCFLMVVVVGMAAFAVDFGYAYANRRALSTAADSAALAAARELEINRTGSQTCSQLLTSANLSAASAIASSYVTLSAPAGSSAQTVITCSAVGNPVVSVTATMASPAFFGGIYDKDSYALTRIGKAVIAPASSVSGSRPLAICSTDVDALVAKLTAPGVGAAVSVTLDKTSDTTCTATGSGNWSRVDFNGGSNATNEYVDWLTNGYSTPLVIGSSGTATVLADTGNNWPSSVKTAMNSLLDKQFTMPVYSLASGTGNNTSYTVVGFVAVKMCGWQTVPTGTSGNRGYGACYDSTVGMTADRDAIQLRYDRLIPPANVNLDCGIGVSSSTCSKYAPIVPKLFGG